jgi:hypothetical protein
MSRLTDLLNKDKFSLIVRLPESTIAYAIAAEEAGADAISVDIDLAQKDRSEIIEIASSVKIPVGIAFNDPDIKETQFKAFVKAGFDFFEVPLITMPEWMMKFEGAAILGSLSSEYSLDDLTKITKKHVDAIDAAVVPKDDIGRDLTVGDLQQYITIAISTGVPVLVPTQKLIRVSEIPIIWDTGAKGIVLDNVCTGTTIETFKTIVKQFKSAVDSVKE